MKLVQAKPLVYTTDANGSILADMSQFSAYNGSYAKGEWVVWLTLCNSPNSVLALGQDGTLRDTTAAQVAVGQPIAFEYPPPFPYSGRWSVSGAYASVAQSRVGQNMVAHLPMGRQSKLMVTNAYSYTTPAYMPVSGQVFPVFSEFSASTVIYAALFRASPAEVLNQWNAFDVVDSSGSYDRNYITALGGILEHSLKTNESGSGPFLGWDSTQKKNFQPAAYSKDAAFIHWNTDKCSVSVKDHSTQTCSTKIIAQGHGWAYVESTYHRDPHELDRTHYSRWSEGLTILSEATSLNGSPVEDYFFFGISYMDTSTSVGDVLHSYKLGNKQIDVIQAEPWGPKVQQMAQSRTQLNKPHSFADPLMPSVSYVVKDAETLFVEVASKSVVVNGYNVSMRAELTYPAKLVAIFTAGEGGPVLLSKFFDTPSSLHTADFKIPYDGDLFHIFEVSL